MKTKYFKHAFCFLLALCLLSTNILAFAANSGLHLGGISLGNGQVSLSDEETEGTMPEENEPISIAYDEYQLENTSRDFLSSVDGEVTITMLASELDYSSGDYSEYYYNFYSGKEKHYYTVINLLKTICEYNDNINLVFLDPFDIDSKSFLKTYEEYEIKYGDIFIECYANFDGNARTRYDIIHQDEFFNFNSDDNGLNRISSLKLERELISKLYALRTKRDINVALISDINRKNQLNYLKDYLDGRGYKLDSVTLSSEKLRGYDMIIIASPIRDVTLEELVILDTFLSDDDKSVMYFAPKDYVGLKNLYSYFSKWGIDCDENSHLFSDEENFSTKSQLYGKSTGTKYTKSADKLDGFYIMNYCTPIYKSGGDGARVKSLLNTNSKEVGIIEKPDSKKEASDDTKTRRALSTISSRNTENGKSNLIAFSSVDFITSYFALDNNTKPQQFGNSTNANLEFVASVMDKVNETHRGKVSGMASYAVSISEMGYDTTSGLDTNTIMLVAITLTAAFMMLLIIFVVIFNRRRSI